MNSSGRNFLVFLTYIIVPAEMKVLFKTTYPNRNVIEAKGYLYTGVDECLKAV